MSFKPAAKKSDEKYTRDVPCVLAEWKLFSGMQVSAAFTYVISTPGEGALHLGGISIIY